MLAVGERFCFRVIPLRRSSLLTRIHLGFQINSLVAWKMKSMINDMMRFAARGEITIDKRRFLNCCGTTPLIRSRKEKWCELCPLSGTDQTAEVIKGDKSWISGRLSWRVQSSNCCLADWIIWWSMSRVTGHIQICWKDSCCYLHLMQRDYELS